MKSEKGFTLIEMLIVLFIITVLILIAIPNVTKHFSTVDNKGCDAYIKMAQGQVEAYRIDKGEYPTSISALETEGYLKNGSAEKSCKGKKLELQSGVITLAGK
ncbi:competence type IV pilus major pilin ComGC [Kurthia massiliensis]|uniref:competence type IV pilus major pilin ComGC n=1 Tax=Kurthia massiliensis TaxID=1033739 RepID=UPI000288D07E|nr:competence type IV pilus major pilin ComGC [Kurthia massiliensis]